MYNTYVITYIERERASDRGSARERESEREQERASGQHVVYKRRDQCNGYVSSSSYKRASGQHVAYNSERIHAKDVYSEREEERETE